jgi:hypothetical protein
MDLKENRFDYDLEQLEKIKLICDDIKDDLTKQEESFSIVLNDGSKMKVFSSHENLESFIKVMKEKGFKVER